MKINKPTRICVKLVRNTNAGYQFPEPTMQTFFPGILEEFARNVVLE